MDFIGTHAIETRALSKRYISGKKAVEAVKGLDLAVLPGEIFGFLGPNGAGKSTVLQMLTTLLLPSSGTATIAGHDLLRDTAAIRQKIGYVSQGGGVDGGATAYEDLLLQATLHGMRLPTAQRRAREVLAALDLTEIASRLSRTYSGGQRRRLDLALGLIHRPAILFLDEPTTGLDPQSRVGLWAEIQGLRAAGTTIFLTTHYLDEADALCDRIAIIDHGHIIAKGTPTELKQQVGNDTISLDLVADPSLVAELLRQHATITHIQITGQELRLSVAQGDRVLPDLLRLLDANHIALRGLSLAHPTLNDTFLQLTGRPLHEAVPVGEKVSVTP